MDFCTVVVRPFGRHAVGSVLRDADEIAAVLAGEHALDVVRVVLPSDTAAAAEEG